MTTKDEAIKQALEAMNLARTTHGLMLMTDPPQEMWKVRGVDVALASAMEVAKEALTHPNHTQRWNIDVDGDDLLVCDGSHEKHEPCRYERYSKEQPEQEPYGWVTVVRNPGCVEQHWFYRLPERPYLDNAAECHAVYTSPPNREPKMESFIAHAWANSDLNLGFNEFLTLFRAIEKVHGITQKETPTPVTAPGQLETNHEPLPNRKEQ